MGFYYNPGPPEDEEPSPSWRYTFAVIGAVFAALAVPLAILFGGVFGFIGLVVLFLYNAWLGLLAVALLLSVLGARVLWEWRHPPKLP